MPSELEIKISEAKKVKKELADKKLLLKLEQENKLMNKELNPSGLSKILNHPFSKRIKKELDL